MLTKFLKRTVDERDITFKLDKKISSQIEFTQSTVALDNKEILEANTISTSNLTLSGNQTINGLTTIDGSVVLVNAQTDPKNNGLYYTDSSTWSRVTNDLNDVKLIKIIDGDYNSYFYTLINEPVEIGVDDIEYQLLFEPNQTSILSATIPFTHTTLNGATIGYVELLSGTSGKLLDIISLNMEINLTSASTTGDLNLGFESGSDELFYIANSILNGTGTAYYKFMQTYITESMNYAINEGFGIYFNPAFAVSSGSITGNIYLTYRLI